MINGWLTSVEGYMVYRKFKSKSGIKFKTPIYIRSSEDLFRLTRSTFVWVWHLYFRTTQTVALNHRNFFWHDYQSHDQYRTAEPRVGLVEEGLGDD